MLVQEETAGRQFDYSAYPGRCDWSCRCAVGIAACPGGTRARTACQSFEQEKARLAAEQTKNPAAYDAYLRGRAFPAVGGTRRARFGYFKRQ